MIMSSDEPTKRFSRRVDNYVKYRPSYPAEVLTCLQDVYGLQETAVIADIGSGTGLLTQLFLQNGNPVYGVEPNPDMRAAGERFLADYVNFTGVDGTSEATTLAASSLDFVVAGQAAHWFQPELTAVEFRRILKPGGVIALVWNTRDVEFSDFMRQYEQITLDYAREDSLRQARSGGHKREPEFILGDHFEKRTFSNAQYLDYARLKGRTLSSSMMPLAGDPKYEPMLAALAQLFETHQVDGQVTVQYRTQFYTAVIP